MVSIDISSARLVPVAGDSGWLCRLPSAVIWAPSSGNDAVELISACAGAANAAQLLGRVASHLADPEGASWPPFAILAAKGTDVVAVVHGPVEVVVDNEAGPSKLFGGEEVGSWLNRLVKSPTRASCGAHAGRGDGEGLDPIADLREGVVRAAGFVLVPAGVGAEVRRAGRAGREAGGDGRAEGRAEPVPAGEVPAGEVPAGEVPAGAGRMAEVRVAEEAEAGIGARGGRSGASSAELFAEAESPTVIEQPMVSATDATIVEGEGGLFTIGEAASSAGKTGRLGRLTWDNGEVHELAGAVLIGRDVSSDESVTSGKLLPVVPGGQNDSMSRVHAEISGRGAEVVVIDRGSTNGTFVWDEPAKAWQRLTTGQAQAISPGTVLAFGERTATFEPPSR